MKYAVIKCINGNYFIDSEGFTELSKAIIKYCDVVKALWNETTVLSAEVKIVDENLDQVDHYAEYIFHDAPQPSA